MNTVEQRKQVQQVKELQRLCKRQREHSVAWGNIIELEIEHDDDIHPSRPYLERLMKERNKEIMRIIKELENE